MFKLFTFVYILSLMFVALTAAASVRTDTKPMGVVENRRFIIGIVGVVGRSKTEHLSLGIKDEFSKPLYSNASILTFDSVQDVIKVNLEIPPENQITDFVFTRIIAEIEGSNDIDAQIHVVSGGIGTNAIAIELVGKNTEFLRYSVTAYGRKI